MTRIELATPSQLAANEAHQERLARLNPIKPQASPPIKKIERAEPAVGPVAKQVSLTPFGPKYIRPALDVKPIYKRIKKLSANVGFNHRQIAIIGRKSLEKILSQVCREFLVMPLNIRAHQRNRAFTIPRQKAMFRMATETEKSLPAIGRFLNRDHTTVMHGIRAHKKRMMNKQRGNKQ